MGTSFSATDRGYQERLQAFMGSLNDDALYGYKSQADIEAAMRKANIWDDHGFYNQANEKIRNQVWEKAEMARPLVAERMRLQNEETVAAATKKQQEIRAAQKTKQAAYSGRRGTIATGSMGVADPIDESGRKTLLGL